MHRHFIPCILALLFIGLHSGVSAQSRSKLGANTEPGAMYVEDILPKPVQLVVAADSVIYYQQDMQRALGSMANGTAVKLVAMTDTAYKIRGKARHGDVAGWMRMEDLKSADPKLAEKLKAFFERQKQVDALIAAHSVALGMTSEEVKASLGNPSRKSSKISAEGREELLEYSIFDKVPQIATGRDKYGNFVQSTIYVKVEVGRLSISLKGGNVSEIQETMGNPLGTGGLKLVPGPITVF